MSFFFPVRGKCKAALRPPHWEDTEGRKLPGKVRKWAGRGLLGQVVEQTDLGRLVTSPPIPWLPIAVYFGFQRLFTFLFGTGPPEQANTIFV